MKFKTMNFCKKIKIPLIVLMFLITIPVVTAKAAVQQPTGNGRDISILLLPTPNQKESFSVALKNNSPEFVMVKTVEIVLQLPENVTVINISNKLSNTKSIFKPVEKGGKFAVLRVNTKIDPSGGVLELATVETQVSNSSTSYKADINAAIIVSSLGRLTYGSSPVTLNESAPIPSLTRTKAPLISTSPFSNSVLYKQCLKLCIVSNDKADCNKTCDEIYKNPQSGVTQPSVLIPTRTSTPTPTVTQTPALIPRNIPTPTSTIPAASTLTPIAQANTCSFDLTKGDANNSGLVDTSDFNNVRDCAKKGTITQDALIKWTEGIWQPALVK